MRAHQTVKYVSAVDIQIKMAAMIVSGVVRENTSLTMRVPELNMIILMTAMNVKKENTVHIITTLLALYVSAVDTQIKLAAVIVSGVVRENTSLTMRVPELNMIILMTASIVKKEKYRTQYHNSACIICQRSRYTDQTGLGSCKWCSAGKYISNHESTRTEHDDSNDCDECAKGKYRGQTYDSVCVICQRSRYTDQTGLGSCKWCVAGKFIGDSQDTTSEHDNSNDCDVCATGRYRETNVQDKCKYCPAGTYNSYNNAAANAVHHDAHTDCKVCLSGKYRDTYGASSCADCPKGRARAVHSYDGTEWKARNIM